GSDHSKASIRDVSDLQSSQQVQDVNFQIDELRPAYKENEVFIKFKEGVVDKVNGFDQARQRNSSITSERLKAALAMAKVDRLKEVSIGKRYKSLNRVYKGALEKGINVEKAIEIL